MTASDNGLVPRIARLFASHLRVEVPSADVDLFETGTLDSLRFVQLLAALEKVFGLRVTIEDLEVDDFRTLARIATFVSQKAHPLRAHH